MKEYIEREAAVDIVTEWCPDDDGSVGKTGDLRDMLDELEAIPAADVVEVRHAYWRDIQPPDQDNNVQCWCSACGAGELHANGMIVPYCWKCGAKMDGGADDGRT